MARIEKSRATRSPEHYSSSRWKNLRLSDTPKVYDGGVCWIPSTMPSNLDIDTDAVNRLLDRLQLDILVEIANCKGNRAQPSIGGINSSGIATAAATATAEETSALTRQSGQKLVVGIDFQELQNKSFYASETQFGRQEAYAQMVGNELHERIMQCFVEESARVVERDSVRFFSLLTSLLTVAYFYAGLSPRMESGSIESTALIMGMLFFVLAARIATSTYMVSHRMNTDPQFQEEMMLNIAQRTYETDMDQDQAFSAERDHLLWREILNVPLLETAMNTVHLAHEAVNDLTIHPRLFRPASSDTSNHTPSSSLT